MGVTGDALCETSRLGRLGSPGGLMSLYGSAFHVTPVDLCITFQCNLFIYPISFLMEIKLFQIVSKLFQIVILGHHLMKNSVQVKFPLGMYRHQSLFHGLIETLNTTIAVW